MQLFQKFLIYVFFILVIFGGYWFKFISLSIITYNTSVKSSWNVKLDVIDAQSAGNISTNVSQTNIHSKYSCCQLKDHTFDTTCDSWVRLGFMFIIFRELESVSLDIDQLTLKFDIFDHELSEMAHLKCKKSIIHNTKYQTIKINCVCGYVSGLQILLLLLSVIYLLFDIMYVQRIAIVIFIELLLIVDIIGRLRLILIVYLIFYTIYCNTAAIYNVCVVFYFFSFKIFPC